MKLDSDSHSIAHNEESIDHQKAFMKCSAGEVVTSLSSRFCLVVKSF